MTGEAREVTNQLALMLRLDMVWFSGLVQPLLAEILLPCYNGTTYYKSEVRLVNESSLYKGCTVFGASIWALVSLLRIDILPTGKNCIGKVCALD